MGRLWRLLGYGAHTHTDTDAGTDAGTADTDRHRHRHARTDTHTHTPAQGHAFAGLPAQLLDVALAKRRPWTACQATSCAPDWLQPCAAWCASHGPCLSSLHTARPPQGSTLSLSYSQAHPSRVECLILRGIFTLRRAELEFFYQDGACWLFPDGRSTPRTPRTLMCTPHTPRAHPGEMPVPAGGLNDAGDSGLPAGAQLRPPPQQRRADT